MTISDHYTQAAALEDQDEVSPRGERQIWDLPVRIFHWALATAFVGAFLTNRLGVSYFKYHVWCGYAVVILVTFRILWGFVGTYHAQFRNFLRGPISTLNYVKSLFNGRRIEYAGHNPLGAWMVLLLLIILGIQAATGLFSNDDIFNVGPLAGYVTKNLSLKLTSLHRHLFYWIAAAIFLHVAAVFAHRAFDQSDLLKAMINGRKTIGNGAPSISSSRTGLALLLVFGVACALVWVVVSAPVAIDDF